VFETRQKHISHIELREFKQSPGGTVKIPKPKNLDWLRNLQIAKLVFDILQALKDLTGL
jgi:hypothetical protein